MHRHLGAAGDRQRSTPADDLVSSPPREDDSRPGEALEETRTAVDLALGDLAAGQALAARRAWPGHLHLRRAAPRSVRPRPEIRAVDEFGHLGAADHRAAPPRWRQRPDQRVDKMILLTDGSTCRTATWRTCPVSASGRRAATSATTAAPLLIRGPDRAYSGDLAGHRKCARPATSTSCIRRWPTASAPGWTPRPTGRRCRRPSPTSASTRVIDRGITGISPGAFRC